MTSSDEGYAGYGRSRVTELTKFELFFLSRLKFQSIGSYVRISSTSIWPTCIWLDQCVLREYVFGNQALDLCLDKDTYIDSLLSNSQSFVKKNFCFLHSGSV